MIPLPLLFRKDRKTLRQRRLSRSLLSLFGLLTALALPLAAQAPQTPPPTPASADSALIQAMRAEMQTIRTEMRAAVDSALKAQQAPSGQGTADKAASADQDLIAEVGVMVGLLNSMLTIGGIVVAIAIALGLFEFRRRRKSRLEVEQDMRDQLEANEKQARQMQTKLQEHLAVVEQAAQTINEQVQAVTAMREQAEASAQTIQGELDKVQERQGEQGQVVARLVRDELDKLPDLSLNEEPSEETKQRLDELTLRLTSLEAGGGELKAEDYLKRGNDFFYKEEYDEALKAYDRVTELVPQDATAWNNKGIALGKLGRYDEALLLFDVVINIDPQHAQAWYNKGVALGELGRDEEALRACEKAIEIDPQHATVWANKGCAYALQNDKNQALEALQKAIEIDPGYKEKALTNEDFQSLRDDPDFKRLVGAATEDDEAAPNESGE